MWKHLLPYSLVFALLAGAAHATPCQGNACDDIVVSKQDQCILLINTGTQRITVNIGGHLYQVYGMSDMIPAPIGYPCWTSILGIEANYE